MVKKQKNSRLAEVKHPQSHAKNHFQPKILAKRRENHYKNAIGIYIRFPRAARRFKRIRKEQNKAYKQMTGIDNTSNIICKSYTETIIGALDAYANLLVNIAKKKNEKGKKLHKSDLEFAEKMIKICSK